MSQDRLPHLLLEGTVRPEGYTPAPGRGPSRDLPSRLRATHAAHLVSRFEQAWSSAMERRGAVAITAPAGGVYLEFESDPEHRLTVESLSHRPAGIELVNVRARRDVEVATVFVPEGKLSTFVRKVESYRDEQTDRGAPRNQKLIDSISDVRLAALECFWTDEPDLFPEEESEADWEVWLRRTSDVDEQVARLAALEGVSVTTPRFDFVELTAFLVRADPGHLAAAVDLLDVLAELRLAKSPADVLRRRLDRSRQLEELAQRIKPAGQHQAAVCLLDGGVDRGHPLIKGSLAASDDQSYDPAWPLGDSHGHGTAMAGVALFGDLLEALAGAGELPLGNRLESVKAIHRGAPHDPQNYGHVVQECVGRAETAAPNRARVILMPITAPDSRDRGRPSLWSAAIDDIAAGTQDDERRLFVLSAGNIFDLHAHLGYPDRNLVEQVQDPGQAWNALTVGAYAERVVITEPDYAGWEPIARRGELSPVSTTSVTWDTAKWPIKPELVLEGGNTAADPAGQVADTPESLSILSTAPILRGSLAATGDTSAAAAAAARMGALVQARYPGLWPETVRALLVHSAEHTDAMVAQAAPQTTRADRERLLRMVGYGVPDLGRALDSISNDLSMVVQDKIQPFTAGGGMHEMHVHELPWPRAELAALGSAQVELCVTLSYFVEASPGRRGWGRKHRYASHGLRFDVRTPTESLDEFRARVNHAARSDDIDESSSDAAEWWLGPTVRCKGSLHHDRWSGTAAELAERAHLAVYPVLGWWRERRHLNRATRKSRYALVVRIRAPEVDVDLYSTVAAMVEAAPVPVAVET